MAYTPITPLPTAPQRTDPPATFITLADAFVAALAAWETDVNAAGSYIDDIGTQVDIDATQVAADKLDAEAAADAAAATANATKWISGTTYAIGDVTWSPIDYQSYRRKTAGAGTTDPSADSTNWEPLKVGGVSWIATAETTAFNITVGEGYRVDTATTGAVTGTFPASPSDGDRVDWEDSKSNFDSASFTLARNGKNINGAAEDFEINLKGFNGKAVYHAADNNWNIS